MVPEVSLLCTTFMLSGSFVVSEKQSKSKHLQTISGVSPSAYWISTLLWDILNYQFTLWITVVLMFAFDIEALTTTKHGIVGGVIALLFFYGPAAASFTYCTTFMFSSPAYCNVFNIVVGVLTGLFSLRNIVLTESSNTHAFAITFSFTQDLLGPSSSFSFGSSVMDGTRRVVMTTISKVDWIRKEIC